MIKPNGYDSTVSSLGYVKPIELGGHKMVIKELTETTGRANQPVVVIKLDTSNQDRDPHYYSDRYIEDNKPDKKWPHAGTFYLNVYERGTNNCSRQFKTFCESVEKSDPAGQFKVNFDVEDFGAQFQGRLIGGIIGDEIGFYNGAETKLRKVRFFCPYNEAYKQRAPEPLYTDEWKKARENYAIPSTPSANLNVGAANSSLPDDFMMMPDDAEELPFN